MIGPTGVGKTEIARRLARLAGCPFVKVEASKYTEVGYVGRDVESMVRCAGGGFGGDVRGSRDRFGGVRCVRLRGGGRVLRGRRRLRWWYRGRRRSAGR